MSKEIRDQIEKILPSYNEDIVLQKGEKSLLCKWFGHKEFTHDSFMVQETSRGTERYEVYACWRCHQVRAKLVHIVPKKGDEDNEIIRGS